MVNPTCPHVTRTRVTRPPGADLGESNRNSVPLVGLPMDGASMVQLRVRRVVGGEVPQTRLWKHPSPGTLGLHMTRSPRRRRARTEIVLSRRAWLVSRSGQNNGTCHRRCVSRGRSTWPFDHAQHMGNARHGAHARRRRQGRARRARRRGCNCSESRIPKLRYCWFARLRTSGVCVIRSGAAGFFQKKLHSQTANLAR
jgi:hypothetical protein